MDQLGFHSNVRQPITAPAYVIAQPEPQSGEKPVVELSPVAEDGFVPSQPIPREMSDSPELRAAQAEVKKARWGRAGSVLKTAAFLAVGAAAVATLPFSGTVALGLGVTGAVGTVLSGVEVANTSERVAQAKSKVEALANAQPTAPLATLEDNPQA